MIGRSTFVRGPTWGRSPAVGIYADAPRLANAPAALAGEHDIEFRDRNFAVAGTDKAVDLTQVTRDAFVAAKAIKMAKNGAA